MALPGPSAGRVCLFVIQFPPYIGTVQGAEAKGSFIISGCEVVLPERVVHRGAVLAETGTIVFAGAEDELPKPLPEGCLRIPGEGQRACPALWETHIHGCGGVSTEGMTAESLGRMATFLAQRGIGAFLPTVVPHEETLRTLGEALDSADATVKRRALGMYVEGPFVAATKRGAIPQELLRAPSMEYLLQMVELSRRHIRMLTVAPELEGAPALIAQLPGLGILPAVGHSDASFESLAAVDGIEPLVVTHLFNGMSGVSHKSPGLAQWALMNHRVYTELNGDGTHVHDATVRLTLMSRPVEKIIAISDAVAPAGLPLDQPPGRLYGKPLTARGSGLFYQENGVLVGSRFLVADAVARLVSDFHVPVSDAVAMASRNPARLFGLPRKGALMPGFDADVALFSADFSRCTFLSWEGEVLHK
jgi:N-acetylglucosamine-6-phosphate deacetylase